MYAIRQNQKREERGTRVNRRQRSERQARGLKTVVRVYSILSSRRVSLFRKKREKHTAMNREQLQLKNLRRLLENALIARDEEEFEYWKMHFTRYLNKLYHQKIKNHGSNARATPNGHSSTSAGRHNGTNSRRN